MPRVNRRSLDEADRLLKEVSDRPAEATALTAQEKALLAIGYALVDIANGLEALTNLAESRGPR